MSKVTCDACHGTGMYKAGSVPKIYKTKIGVCSKCDGNGFWREAEEDETDCAVCVKPFYTSMDGYRCLGCDEMFCDDHYDIDEEMCISCSKVDFEAPTGYTERGPRPFYGNPRKMALDRWGNRRFIRRRKDGTYMKNVDVGRSLAMDRRRQSQTWAPAGYRDQGDGSPSLLVRLLDMFKGMDEEVLMAESYLMCADCDTYSSECGCHNSESDAYIYAYNDGHLDGRSTNVNYRPSANDRELTDFKKIFKQAEGEDTCLSCKQKLEEDEMTLQCSDCYEDGCSMCMDDFCGDCDSCNDCCECKCSVCDGEDWQMTETSEGNVCRSCYEYCHLCQSRRHPEQMASGGAENYCKECVEDMNSCESCGDYLQPYDERQCVECDEVYCESCSDNELSMNEEDEQVCTSCVPSKTDKKSAENLTPNQQKLVDALEYEYYDDSDPTIMIGMDIADQKTFQKLLKVCQENDGIIDSSHPAEAYIIAIKCWMAIFG